MMLIAFPSKRNDNREPDDDSAAAAAAGHQLRNVIQTVDSSRDGCPNHHQQSPRVQHLLPCFVSKSPLLLSNHQSYCHH